MLEIASFDGQAAYQLACILITDRDGELTLRCFGVVGGACNLMQYVLRVPASSKGCHTNRCISSPTCAARYGKKLPRTHAIRQQLKNGQRCHARRISLTKPNF